MHGPWSGLPSQPTAWAPCDALLALLASIQVILDEKVDPNYQPSQSEINEYAEWLGMDLDKEKASVATSIRNKPLAEGSC